MDIKQIVVDAIKNKKTEISFSAPGISEITLDTFIRIGVKNSPTPTATYTYTRNPSTNQVTVKFSYTSAPKPAPAPAPSSRPSPSVTPRPAPTPSPRPAPSVSPRPAPSPAPRSSATSESRRGEGMFSRVGSFIKDVGGFRPAEIKSVSVADGAPVDIYNRGSINFVKDMDLLKSNVFHIHGPNYRDTLNLLDRYSTYVTGALEGVVGYRSGVLDKRGEQVVELYFPLGMKFEEFKNKLIEGRDKAIQKYKEISNNVTLPEELRCLLVYGFIEKEAKYNYDYLHDIMSHPGDISYQKIENAMAYGTIVNRLAICEGFSWAAIYMLQAAGLEADVAFGKLSGSGHQWVKVKVNGEWYNFDPTITFDSPKLGLLNFLASDDYLRSKGYTIEDFEHKATSRKYEGDNLERFIDRIPTLLAPYVSRGLPRKWLDYEYAMLITE